MVLFFQLRILWFFVGLIASEMLQSSTEMVTELYSHRHRGVVLLGKLFVFHPRNLCSWRPNASWQAWFSGKRRKSRVFQMEFVIKVQVKSLKSSFTDFHDDTRQSVRENLFKIKFYDRKSKRRVMDCKTKKWFLHWNFLQNNSMRS